MKTNTAPTFTAKTHEGAPAAHLSPYQQLRRSVMACMLWEDTFYEDGVSIAQRIHKLAEEVPTQKLAELAVEARTKGNLRHAPLWLLVALIKKGSGSSIVSDTIAQTIQRADEMGELVSLYWKDGKRPLAKQLQKGLAKAFVKFSAYDLGKYNRDAAVKLRDVLFLSHAKPQSPEQEAMWKRLIDKELETPDTWEVALSGGADKGETFTRLLKEGKLGYLALLRNLRNMAESKVDPELVKAAIVARKGAHRVLPFRYTAAARAAPQFEPALDQALLEAIFEMPVLEGRTVVLVDVSGSMESKISAKSDLTRLDAAATLAAIIPGDVRVFSFSQTLVEVPARRGMAGVDAIIRSQSHGGTDLGGALRTLYRIAEFDRLIVLTDEQSSTALPPIVGKRNYMINVAAYQHGVGYGPWVRIDGFSESVLTYIGEHERAGV